MPTVIGHVADPVSDPVGRLLTCLAQGEMQGLTPDRLREPHGPIPRNPLIAEPLYRIKYVEKAGTGTTDMIADCRKAGLPEPDFEQRGPYFVATVWRNWLTEDVIASFGLSERQQKAINILRQEHRLTNTKYQEITGVSRATAKRDLEELTRKNLIILIGSGRGVYYQIPKKRLINGSNGSCYLEANIWASDHYGV